MHVFISMGSVREVFRWNDCRISWSCFSGFWFGGRSLTRRVRVRYVDRIFGLVMCIAVGVAIVIDVMR